MCRGLRSSLWMLFGWWFSLNKPSWAQVIWLCRYSYGVLDPSSDSLNPFSHSSTRLLEVLLMFDCMSLHLFPSVGWSLWMKTVMQVSCLLAYQNIINSVSSWLSPFGCVSSWGISCPFLQSLLHLYPRASCRQGILWFNVFLYGLLFQILHWKSWLATGSGHFSLHIPRY